jgi:chemotaxis protein CheX
MVVPLAQKRHDLELIEPFLLAIVETMKVQCGLAVRPGEPFRKDGGESFPTDVIAVFGVLSRAMGDIVSVAICFSDKDYHAIMERFFHQDDAEAKAGDGIGEMVSMVFARVKKLMNLDGQIIKRMIPTMISGKDLKISYLTSGKSVVVPLDTDVGKFHLELTME